MNLFAQLSKVRTARAEMALARLEISIPAAALIERGRKNPLTTVGAAAGTGFVLGTLNVQPLQVPGVSSLLGGGLGEIMSYGTQLISELGAFGLGSMKSDHTGQDDQGTPMNPECSPPP